MGVNYNAKVVTNGLVAYWDAANIRSYRYNMLSYTNNISAGYAVNGTLATGQSDPIGGTSAAKITATSIDPYVQNTSNLPSVIAGQTYNLSIWMKGEGTAIGKNFTLAMYDGTAWVSGSWGTSYVITAGWQRVSQTFTPANSGSAQIRFDCPESGSPAIGDVCYVWGLQLSGGSGLLNYLPNATTSDYTTWNDLSVNGSTMTTTNSPTFSSGSFVFNGTNQYASAPNNTALDNQTFTVSVWVNCNTTTVQNGFWFEKGTVNSQHALFLEGGYIKFRTSIGGTLTDTMAPLASTYMSPGIWYNVVYTFVSGSQVCYINGVPIATGTTVGTVSTNAGGMSIGAYGGQTGGHAYYFSGNITAVKVYNRALSAIESKQNYNALRGRFRL